MYGNHEDVIPSRKLYGPIRKERIIARWSNTVNTWSPRDDGSVGSGCFFVMSLGCTFRTPRKAALDRRKHISLRYPVDETGFNRHVSHVVQTSDVVPVPLTVSLAIVVGKAGFQYHESEPA